jgi:PIN domain nuclease of toxin-antitoxin system
MRYLLDTHALIWSLTEPEKLTNHVKFLLVNPEVEIVVSTISFWEISLKYSLGKLDIGVLIPEDFPKACKRTGYEVLDLVTDTSSTYHKLTASYHKDPFDRMLIWQALSNRYALISDDDNIRKYAFDGLEVVW